MIDNWNALATTSSKRLALECVEKGIHASHPRTVIQRTVDCSGSTLSVAGSQIDLDAYEKVIVVGAGKASGAFAEELESLLGSVIDDGIVIAPTSAATERITTTVGTHPLPSETNVDATEAILTQLRHATAETLVLVLISGGGSALLTAPPPTVSLEAVQDVTNQLLESGAPIPKINAVRKHLSRVKGGQLAQAAAPATVVGLIMSDVVGDDLSVIASGPTVPDSTTYSDVDACFRNYAIDPPAAIAERIRDGTAGRIAETPGPAEIAFESVTNILVADSGTPLRAAAALVQDRGYNPLILSSRIQGESREAAKSLVAIGEEIQQTGRPVAPPAVVLTGGETTVTITGDGDGGPNQEFAVGGAIDIPDGIALAAVDTDGIDGSTNAAGGIVDASTVDDREAARSALQTNDTNPYLSSRDALIRTGPTGTNVNDFRVMVVEPLD